MNEPSSNHPRVAEWLAHVRALSVEIGPRGPTREGERQGAEYARRNYEQSGLAPVWETFKSARSIFHPHLLGSLLMLAAFAIFPLGGRVTALVSSLLSVLVILCLFTVDAYLLKPPWRTAPRPTRTALVKPSGRSTASETGKRPGW